MHATESQEMSFEMCRNVDTVGDIQGASQAHKTGQCWHLTGSCWYWYWDAACSLLFAKKTSGSVVRMALGSSLSPVTPALHGRLPHRVAPWFCRFALARFYLLLTIMLVFLFLFRPRLLIVRIYISPCVMCDSLMCNNVHYVNAVSSAPVPFSLFFCVLCMRVVCLRE